MTGKPVDLLVGTKVNNGLTSNTKIEGFNLDHADYRFMEKNLITPLRSLSKTELADVIFERINL